LGAVLLVLKQNRADIIAAHKAFIAATKDTAEAQHSFAEWLRNDAVTVGRANQAAAEALERVIDSQRGVMETLVAVSNTLQRHEEREAERHLQQMRDFQRAEERAAERHQALMREFDRPLIRGRVE
jgi:flagellar hook-basal body complex protein FliE